MGLGLWIGLGLGSGLRLGLGCASTVRSGRPKAVAQLAGLERSLSIVREMRAYL